ncbi:response regulator transcription factor [Alloacidobacterium sp.]|uniref:response regulator transcription factor n=1 Tax=Alloacidobacterium sp. TaxID=2951999 RepID=UPI002D3A9BCB|nr:response regulator transcription factor [Alloacidobacterium sp.]HYK35507.1 response regulator transcription factor [Alloacidobacterium sp.]
MAKPRLLLADDHTLIVEAFTKLLETEFEIVGIVADGSQLLKTAPELKPDVVILDLNMLKLNGMDVGKQLKRMLPLTKIIVLTMSDDFEFAAQALRQWASAYLLKKSAASELIRAIHEVLKGKTYVTSRVARRLLEEFVRESRPEHEAHLTKRQKEVLQLLAEGHTMRQVAVLLDISTRTVAFHKYQMMQQHGLKSQSDIVMFAIKQRVVALPV